MEMEFSLDKYSFHPSEVVDEEEWETEGIKTAETEYKLDDQAPKILIVEDNKSLRNFLVKELSHSYRIVEAADGKEGIYEAYKHIPDLILSDIMMPEVDGLALCKELKTNEKTSHIPINSVDRENRRRNSTYGFRIGSGRLHPKALFIPSIGNPNRKTDRATKPTKNPLFAGSLHFSKGNSSQFHR